MSLCFLPYVSWSADEKIASFAPPPPPSARWPAAQTIKARDTRFLSTRPLLLLALLLRRLLVAVANPQVRRYCRRCAVISRNHAMMSAAAGGDDKSVPRFGKWLRRRPTSAAAPRCRTPASRPTLWCASFCLPDRWIQVRKSPLPPRKRFPPVVPRTFLLDLSTVELRERQNWTFT